MALLKVGDKVEKVRDRANVLPALLLKASEEEIHAGRRKCWQNLLDDNITDIVAWSGNSLC